MYNLLVSGDPQAWVGSTHDFDQSRCINANEYTEEGLAKKYGRLDEAAIAEIIKFPAIFAYEGYRDEVARLGWITRVRMRQRVVRINLEFDPSGVSIQSQQLHAMSWDLDIADWELGRSHWALKNVDLFEALGEAGLIELTRLPGSATARKGAQHFEITPRIFKIPASKPDPLLVSVMMPYGGFDAVYDALESAVQAAGFTCERADKFWEESELMQDIFSLIYRSTYVICDFTNSNPNVFYEAGIAHTLGREVIPIAQSPDHVPFDLRHHRYIRYLNNAEGRNELTTAVQKRLEYLKLRDSQ